MKTFLFFALLFYVSCGSIYHLGYTQDLDSIPQFVQLTQSPISRGFSSLISLHLKENSSSEGPSKQGYATVMNLVNELIHNNRKQIQEIIKINHRVEGQCLISKSNLKNRANNFKSLQEYFRLKAKTNLKERSQSINMRDSRKIHIKDYSEIQIRIKRQFAIDIRRYERRVSTAKYAMDKTDGAIKAVNEWKPSTAHSFIETSIKETVSAYFKATHYPLEFDYTFLQLAANDIKVKRRLYEWLNMLKATLIRTLSLAQSSKAEVERNHNRLNLDMTRIIRLLKRDVRRLNHVITNADRLIKHYSGNESIYTRLYSQTNLVIEASNKWCDEEGDNYKKNKETMQEQLRVFVELKEWFRHNFNRVRQWIAKKYA